MLDLISLLLISAAFFFGHLYASIAGGAGILTLPTLLLFGVSPAVAIGTISLATFFGVLTSSFNYHRKKIVNVKSLKWLTVAIVIGSFIGALITTSINPDTLKLIITIALIPVVLLSIFSDRLMKVFKIKLGRIGTLISFFIIGVYSTTINAGYAILQMTTLVFSGKTFLESSAAKSMINIAFLE